MLQQVGMNFKSLEQHPIIKQYICKLNEIIFFANFIQKMNWNKIKISCSTTLCVVLVLLLPSLNSSQYYHNTLPSSTLVSWIIN